MKMTEVEFEKFFKGKLTEREYARGIFLWKKYAGFSSQFFSALLHGVQEGKVDEVLEILERCWREDINFPTSNVSSQVRGKIIVEIFIEEIEKRLLKQKISAI